MNFKLKFSDFLSSCFWMKILLIAVCLTVFWPTLKTGFMLDDPFLLRAAQIPPGFNISGFKSDFTSNVPKEKGMFYYRPLLGALTRIEFSIFGEKPLGYHLVSLAFHTVNSILILMILSKLKFNLRISFFSACLFASNPVIIDDLLSATGGESMANFFLLSSLLLFLTGKAVYGMFFSFPAMFAKESNTVLPILLFLCLAYSGRLKKEYRNIFFIIPPLALFLFMRSFYVDFPPEMSFYSIFKFLFMAFPGIILHYIKTLFLPLNLETWPRVIPVSSFWYLILGLEMAVAATFLFLRGWRRLFIFCACWFLVMMFPKIPAIMSNLVLMDKWVFMSSPGVFVFGLVLLSSLAEKWKNFFRLVPHLFVIFFVFFWAVIAHANVKLRGSDEKNYRWTIRNTPHVFANYRLGVILIKQGRSLEAVEVLEPLIKINIDDPDLRNAYAMALWHSGRQKEAMRLMKELRKKYPENIPIRENASLIGVF